jgi:nucleoid-associated protein YgaU
MKVLNRLFRGIFALAALVAILVGLPWALVHYGNWPIRTLPDRQWLESLNHAVSDDALFAALTVAAWAIWAAFAYAVVVEMRAAARGIRPPRIHFFGPIQSAAHGIVAGLVLAVSIHHAATAAGAATLPVGFVPAPVRHVAIVEPFVRPTPTRAAPATAQTFSAVLDRQNTNEQLRTVTVERGDSAWSVAEKHLGDPMRWRELWELNRHTVQPDGRMWNNRQTIVPGWILRLPGATEFGESPAAMAPTDGSQTYTVVRGDTLTDIAEDELGDGDRYREIYDLSRSIDQPGHRHLTDPNLILPGWTLEIPGKVPAPAAVAPVIPPPVEQPPATEPVTPMTAPPTSTTSPASTATTRPASPNTVPATAPTTAAAEPTTWPPPASNGSAASNGQHSTNRLGVLAGIGGSLVLATALGARMSKLRRHRISRGLRPSRLVEDHADNIRTIVRAGDMPFTSWASHELGALALRLDPREITGAPEAIELSQTTGIEILWDTEQPDAPSPWRAADGGWAWRLAYDEDAHTPKVERCSPVPALVTIGTREGRQLLLDLEAYGTISVCGPDELVDGLLRSIATELAVSDTIANSYLDLVGFDLPVEHLGNRVRHTTIDEATGYLKAFSGSVEEAIAAGGFDSTFLARLGDTPPIEASVVIVGRNVDGACSLVKTPARRGVAVVLAGEHPDASASIRINCDGTARIDDLGVDFTAAHLAGEASVAIDEAMAELIELVKPPMETVEADDANVEATDTDDASDENEDEDDEIASLLPIDAAADIDAECCADGWPEVIVRVIGEPSVPSRPDLGRRETIATVALACHAKALPSSMLQDAVYADRATEPHTVENVVHAMRKQLGKFNDDTAVMPRSNKGKLGLDPRVKTDVQLLQHALESAPELSSAEALMMLDRAHRLIDGPPFDAKGYSWAHEQHFVSEATEVVAQATIELVDRALELDMIDVARHATRRAFRALNCHESLYRARMKVEHHAGNLPGVRAAYDELSRELAAVDGTPARATDELLRRLMYNEAG